MTGPYSDTSKPDPAASRGPAAQASGTGSLDDVFRSNVRRRPDALALCDPPDRAVFVDGAVRQLTYAQADQAVQRIAGMLGLFGLPPGAAVALQLPNTVESVLTLLAVWRAGMVAVPLPLLWRKTEAASALAAIGAQALICCGRIGAVDHGELAREIAAETFSIRAVAGFGDGLPDGVVRLDDHDAALGGAAPPSFAPDRVAERIALVTFDTVRDGALPIARTHTELMVAGLATVMEAAIPRHGAILATPLLSSMGALATTVIPWLLTGGMLALHQPFEPPVLAAQQQQPFAAIVVPGPLVAPLAAAGLLGRKDGKAGAAAVIALWRAPERQPASPLWRSTVPLIDVLAFGEIGLMALRRGPDGRPRLLAEGPVTTPSGTAGAPVMLTVGRTSAGTLVLAGPMVTRRTFPPQDRSATQPPPRTAVDTGYPCSRDPATRALILDGPPSGLVGVGGYRFALDELQDIVGRVDAHGFLAALPDMLAGQKLAGVTADIEAMRTALAALGVNPLVGAAFRTRGGSAPAA